MRAVESSIPDDVDISKFSAIVASCNLLHKFKASAPIERTVLYDGENSEHTINVYCIIFGIFCASDATTFLYKSSNLL